MAIIGLGNPGPEYEGTRHNAGYRVMEALARELSASRPFRLQKSICATTVYAGSRLILVQPVTYMNLSGQAVAELFRHYRLAVNNLLLIHDELDLPLGTLRFKSGGSSAGHQGVQSVIDSLGNSEFLRLRFGIGRPLLTEETVDYVLETFTHLEQEMVESTVGTAIIAIKLLIREGLVAAMNRFN
ncbi:MAG TPA: aminoacyl-tRNA hydrolase [Firmicutes bacterium]|nr:aminoacyl-tRNA hydrolase [Bacillota bacterium]